MIRASMIALALTSAPVWAQGSLMGLDVTLQVVTYDDPSAPLFESKVQRATVSDQIEFGLVREADPQELDVVPVLIDIQADHIKINYKTADPSQLYPAVFNGYILDFAAPCALFKDASIDSSDTSLPVTHDFVSWEENRLAINVQGLSYNRKSRIAIELAVNTCPASTGGKKSKE